MINRETLSLLKEIFNFIQFSARACLAWSLVNHFTLRTVVKFLLSKMKECVFCHRNDTNVTLILWTFLRPTSLCVAFFF